MYHLFLLTIVFVLTGTLPLPLESSANSFPATSESIPATYDASGTWTISYSDNWADSNCSANQDTTESVIISQFESFVSYSTGGNLHGGSVSGAAYEAAYSFAHNDGTVTGTDSFTLTSETSGAGTTSWVWIGPSFGVFCTGGATITTTKQQSATSPAPPTLTFPAAGATDSSLTPTFTTASFSDPDSGDSHLKTDWQTSESFAFTTSILLESSYTNLTSLTIPDGLLDEGTTYYWHARFYDKDGNASDWSSIYSFTTLTSTTDQNSNGIPDTQEVSSSVDMDSDGEADILQDDIKSLNTIVGNAQLGISRKDDPIITDIIKVESIDPDTISTVARPHTMPLGMVSLKLKVSPGSTATPKIYFSEPAPANATWLMYDSIKGWTDYSDYATFSDDRMSVVLELHDGSHGDSDGAANGIIVDPGGYGVATFISGVVTDTLGTTITNAEVTLTRALTDLTFVMKSLSDGTFFSALLPGDYSFSAAASGYGSSYGTISIPESVVKSTLSISLNTAPTLTTAINGPLASASWGVVTDAERYTFYYAPFPYEGEQTIVSMEMGSVRSVSAELPSGAAYYVAATSWVDGVESGYSNIELIIMP